MNETTLAANGTPKLNEALAKFQAEAPKITKDQKATVRSDKGNYTYAYVDLASVCAVAFPLLAKNGLSFFAKPDVLGSQFGMVCVLKHDSGEEERGFYPLPDKGTPQQVGSAITYARRYSLLMMTGLAPDEDDDGAAGDSQQFGRQSAAEAFENATPAPPRQRQPNGNGQRPAMSESAKADWALKIDGIVGDDDAAPVIAEIQEAMKAKTLDSTSGNALLRAVRIKRDSLANGHQKAGAPS